MVVTTSFSYATVIARSIAWLSYKPQPRCILLAGRVCRGLSLVYVRSGTLPPASMPSPAIEAWNDIFKPVFDVSSFADTGHTVRECEEPEDGATYIRLPCAGSHMRLTDVERSWRSNHARARNSASSDVMFDVRHPYLYPLTLCMIEVLLFCSIDSAISFHVRA
jgi:hypothetical protein